jgi:hypothetical protein
MKKVNKKRPISVVPVGLMMTDSREWAEPAARWFSVLTSEASCSMCPCDYYYLELTLAFGGQSIDSHVPPYGASQQSLSSVVFSAQIDAGVALGSHHVYFLAN